MRASQEDSVPIIARILHPSDFSAASEVAFAHALKAALIAKSQLVERHRAVGRRCGHSASPPSPSSRPPKRKSLK
jgi:hypothetical protein